jgi:iron-sulfur cluster repair protein YtfE (RIC family)
MTAKQGRGSKPTSGSNRRTNTTTSANEKTPDALQLLRRDHAEVKELFERFEKLGEDGPREEKSDIAREACAKLTVHATVEEEIFYPAAREVPDAEALLNEAEVEHGTAKELIAKIDGMDADDEMFDANFTVLSEYIEHHVKEEEGELFPKIQKSDLDLDALGEQIVERKDALMAELELP